MNQPILFPLRLTIPLVLLLFTATLSLWSIKYNGSLSDDKVEAQATAELIRLMTRLQISIEHAYAKDDKPAVAREISGLASDLDYSYILLFDERGKVLASNRAAFVGQGFIEKLDGVPDSERKQIFTHLSEVRRNLSGQVYLTEDRQRLVAIYPLILSQSSKAIRDPNRGYLMVFEDLDAQKREALESVYRQLIQFCLILGILTVGLGVFFDQIVSRRINRIVGVTRRVGRGDYSVRTGLTGLDEIGRLAAAIDEMARSRAAAEGMLLKLNRAVEQSPVSVVITDLAGQIEYANPKLLEVTGYELEEVIGQNPRVFKSGYHDQLFYQKLWTELTAGRQWKAEMRNKKKNGEAFWEWVTITPILDDSGRIINYLGVKEDITLKKQRDEELLRARRDAEAANQAKTNFLATMSHELRTPMNGIMGMSQILLAEEESPDKRSMLDVVMNSSIALVGVLDEILDITKIEASQFQTHLEPTDLNQLLKDLGEMFWAAAKSKNLDLSCSTQGLTQSLYQVDPSMVTKVLSNLLANAIKFTAKGSVRLRVKEIELHGAPVLRFEVEDTGVGIPASKIDQIFLSFTQVDSSSTRRYGGVGLGLAIALNLVRLMGGELGVQSREGEGSLFWFELQAQGGFSSKEKELAFGPSNPNELEGLDLIETSPRMISKKPVTLGSVGKGKKILVVEDDSINASVINRILTLNDFTVIEAENGKKALEILANQSVDLVLMDCLMPVLDGYRTSKMIRDKEAKGEFKGHVPIVAVTAKAMEEDRAKCLEAGMDDYLSKPVEMKHLLEVIAGLLGRDKGRVLL